MRKGWYDNSPRRINGVVLLACRVREEVEGGRVVLGINVKHIDQIGNLLLRNSDRLHVDICTLHVCRA